MGNGFLQSEFSSNLAAHGVLTYPARNLNRGALMLRIPIVFPTELERVHRQVSDEAALTPEERLNLVFEMLDFAKQLNPDQDVFGSDDPFWNQQEAEWQRRMNDLFRRRIGRDE